jgi:CRISPR/Cas system-associated exonuclease Cas4 (RecB family)
MIVEKILEKKEKDIKQYPVHTNRASDLGHPCVRYHVLNRTRWEERSLHDTRLQLIFDLGKEIEDITIRDMQAAGFQVIEQQRPFTWKEYNITGTVDGKVLIDGEAVPFEVKSCSQFVFDKLAGVADMTRGKYGYLRKYPTQLNLYMLMDNKERGVFIFKNKQTGAYKEIWMDLDYQLGEETLKRSESVNAHISAGTLPDPINDDMWCNDCPYAHICLPEVNGREVDIDTGELGSMLDRMEVLKAAVTEYDELDAQVKKMVEGREKVLAGNWYISGKWMDRKSYDIPADLKAQYEKITKYWRKTIRRAA